MSLDARALKYGPVASNPASAQGGMFTTPSKLIALVTGGNRGIGLEVVKALLASETVHTVWLGCRDFDLGAAAATELSKTFGNRCRPVQLTVDDPVSVASAAHAVAMSANGGGGDGDGAAGVDGGGGHLDILINNAGIMLGKDGAPFSAADAEREVEVNFGGVVAVSEAFLPLLTRAPGGGVILSTSSGVGTRTLGLLSESHRAALMDPGLDLPALQVLTAELLTSLADDSHPYHEIPSVGYGISKMAVNCYTQILARQYPALRVNACSPGFCNTGMCDGYTGKRVPKDPELGASVFAKVLFGGLGRDRNCAMPTSTFFKEASAPGTSLAAASSVAQPWVTAPKA